MKYILFDVVDLGAPVHVAGYGDDGVYRHVWSVRPVRFDRMKREFEQSISMTRG